MHMDREQLLLDIFRMQVYNIFSKTGGGEQLNYYMEYATPVGILLLTCAEEALTGLWMNRHPSGLEILCQDHPVLRKSTAWLDGYFSNRVESIPVSLSPAGTAFQQRVWKRLLDIPYGQVITYGDIAREIERETGKRMSSQAVGGAVGSNPISIMIPCHRVVGAGGKLTGYAGGIEKKEWLLRHEGWEGVKKHDHK